MAIDMYSQIGLRLWSSWGRDAGSNAHRISVEAIKQLSDDARQVCLLAAIVDKLDDINRQLVSQNHHLLSEPRTPHHVADGHLRCLQLATGDHPIDESLIHRLSVRARNTILRSGIPTLSQVTAERLKGIRNCGPATIDEIMAWVETQRGGVVSTATEDMK